nr:MAG TPA: hypothetical protein [Herelleviridae sp.]DAM71559.1 MAG TPA: hypothetical protein [Caudoviricetes sp.]DAP49097.1 MAG TPA: hypothetical protein [Caudoviricetes sp.]
MLPCYLFLFLLLRFLSLYKEYHSFLSMSTIIY